MGGIIEDIQNDGLILSLFAAIAILLVIIIIIYLLSTIGGGQSSYIGRGNNSRNANNRYCESEKLKKDQELLSGNRVYYNQDSYYSQSYKHNYIPNKEENNSPSNNEEDNDEKQSPIRQSINGDGTVRTEINFNSDFTIENPEPASFLPKYEYLETANNGQFRKLLPSDEKSFFRTWEENGIRKFEFHGNVDKALANINAIFDDVCEIEGKQNGATQIGNEEPGTLDNNLKVITPAKIKLS